MTNDQYADKVEQYWVTRRRQQLKRKSLGLPNPNVKKRKMTDFSEEEKKLVYEESMEKSMSREKVAEKHDTLTNVIDAIIFRQGYLKI